MGMYGEAIEITLPSGRILRIEPAHWKTSLKLLKTITEELHHDVRFRGNDDTACLLKDAVCLLVHSEKIEKVIWDCFHHCTIDKVRIDDDAFQKVENRGDYLKACQEVTTVNIHPLVRPHLPELQDFAGKMLLRLLSQFQTTASSSKSNSQNSDTEAVSRQV